ncbi:precorrin-6y C5,15-methyltransferase (decarboxylating) subunit CbiE [Aphanothece sacrum]|uniref:ATP-binding protein n=1 Tax=Aphanothece sacrum FPU1 TaxID=1920663 RepID=A0A401ILE1_APHSA|nr:precorrin-6y C5,15-methyltransferase (decarboxylating) subunit CbiE [Aphanothece sacrum]GBF82057.1 ATP-binding protein [Aphanothece sacrum FPU1]GBF85870.1 ATP-binding protein [Aphanothece sacrum FPU3]
MIDVVGIGLDGINGLTEKVQIIVNQATLLVGSDRHLSYFPNHPAKQLILSNFLESIEIIKESNKEDQLIVILVSGDPLFFGLGRLLLEYFKAEELQFYPHLNCVQLAFNQLKIPWQDAKIISGHGRELNELIPLLQQGIEKIAILTDSQNNPSAIARLYLSLDLTTHYDFIVCENLGSIKEKIIKFEPEELAIINPELFEPLNILILLSISKILNIDPKKLPLFGLSDHYFLSFKDRPGLMTKKEIRCLILGELELKPDQIIWDIGAGTGSVSIEIGRLCPTSQIYAIEKTAIGITLIEQNCQNLNVNNVVAISGKAPNNLSKLPQPERIFIGGSGGNLNEILGICQEKIVQDGILVIALATLENLSQSLTWLQTNNWDYQVLNLQISRSVSLKNLTRFSPLNPVILIKATQKNFGSTGLTMVN